MLVRVRSTTVNRTDCGFRAAKPFVIRLFAGLRRPRHPVLGCEFAGVVEAIGDTVFRPVLDRTYPLDGIVDAYRYVETGQKVGNVVIHP